MKPHRNSGKDCITNLPANIIDTILGCLPLCDAVRTSVLSTEWRNRWKSVPKLVFDFNFNKPPLCNHKLESIIYHVLLQHRGHINKFALQVFSYNRNQDIDSWMPLLPSSELQDFTLHLYPCSKQALSHRFFSFQNLMHLNLYRCVFNPPPQFRGFTKLITLDFQDVEFLPAVFEQFISLCSMLERVRLVSCTELDAFELDAPCLRSLLFHGVFKTIHFKNSPVLTEVSLSIPTIVNRETPISKGFKYFHFLPTLERLHLHPRVLEFLECSEFPESLTSLEALNLSMFLDNVKEVASALRLARNSPHLRMLQVSLYASASVDDVMEFMKKTDHNDLNHIRKVRIGVFSGVGAQIEFVRFVLASAGELEELVITSSLCPAITDSKLMELLKQSPRASPSVNLSLFWR